MQLFATSSVQQKMCGEGNPLLPNTLVPLPVDVTLLGVFPVNASQFLRRGVAKRADFLLRPARLQRQLGFWKLKTPQLKEQCDIR